MFIKITKPLIALILVALSSASPAQPRDANLDDAIEAFRLWSLGIGRVGTLLETMTAVLPENAGNDPDAVCALATIAEFGHLRDHPATGQIEAARLSAKSEFTCPLFLAKVVENTSGNQYYDESRQWAFDALYALALSGNVEAAGVAARFVVQNDRLAAYWRNAGTTDAPARLYEVIQQAPDDSPYKWQSLHKFCRESRWQENTGSEAKIWIRDVLQSYPSGAQRDVHCARLKARKHATAVNYDWRPAPDDPENEVQYVEIFEAIRDRRGRPRANLNAVWPISTPMRLGRPDSPDLVVSLVAGEFVHTIPNSTTSVSGQVWIEVVTAEVDYHNFSDGVSGWIPQSSLVLGSRYQPSMSLAKLHLQRGDIALPVAILAVLASRGDAGAYYELGMISKKYATDHRPKVAGRISLSELRYRGEEFFTEAANRNHGPAQMELAALMRKYSPGAVADIPYWYGRAWVNGEDRAEAPALDHARQLPAVTVTARSANLRAQPTTESDVVGAIRKNAVGHRLGARGDWVLALWPKEKALAWIYAPLVQAASVGGNFPPAPAPLPGKTVCSTRCINGDCYRTYSDGRRVRVRAKRVFNGGSNRWDWDAGAC